MGIVRLIGEHISYSASPAMQTAAFAALGLDHTYELLDVPAHRLHGMVRLLRSRAFIGANVTVPYKSDVIRDLNGMDDFATRAEAVNTITKDGGRLLGFNTDVPAIRDEIAALRPRPRKAVILGAGGAARAVAIALEMLSAAEVCLVSPSGRDGAARWTDLPAVLRDADLLVNATPVGTNSDATPLDQSLLHDGLAVLDLVYRPTPTRLVHDARASGLNARAGTGVLLGQGWRSLEAWLSVEVSESVKRAMADALARELGAGVDV